MLDLMGRSLMFPVQMSGPGVVVDLCLNLVSFSSRARRSQHGHPLDKSSRPSD